MRYIATILILLISCSKKDTPTIIAPVKYTLTFKVGEEIPGTVYEIQVSKTGLGFQTLDSLGYDVLRNGVYNLTDIPLSINDLIRVRARNKNDTAYSPVKKAY